MTACQLFRVLVARYMIAKTIRAGIAKYNRPITTSPMITAGNRIEKMILMMLQPALIANDRILKEKTIIRKRNNIFNI